MEGGYGTERRSGGPAAEKEAHPQAQERTATVALGEGAVARGEDEKL
jgi:hypothetical protein